MGTSEDAARSQRRRCGDGSQAEAAVSGMGGVCGRLGRENARDSRQRGWGRTSPKASRQAVCQNSASVVIVVNPAKRTNCNCFIKVGVSHARTNGICTVIWTITLSRHPRRYPRLLHGDVARLQNVSA